jgi:nucleoside-diphosphate-sugar epimerase
VADSPTAVAVTGAAGRIGRVVLDRLLREPGVDRIVAIDVAEPTVDDPRIEWRQRDVRDASIGQTLAGCDGLIHLAFVVEKGSRDPRAVDSINIGGTDNVARAALAAGVDRIAVASSIAAYGFHPDNRGVALREDAPTRGNDDFYYARTKAEIDRRMRRLADDTADASIAILRPSVILGPRGSGDGPVRLLRRRLLPRLAGGGDPPVHVTHEDDVADAFWLALVRAARGPFNVATEEPLPASQWAAAIGSRDLPLPSGLLGLADAAYRLHLIDVDPVWLRAGIDHPIVVDSRRARRQLKWRPRYPTTGAVLRAIAGRPTAAASRGTRILLGTLAGITRLRGSLPANQRQRQELRAFRGSVDLLLGGEQPSEWHIRFSDGRIGVYRGVDPSSRASAAMKEQTFFDMLSGDLSYARANMTGKVRHRGEGNMTMIVGAIVGGFRQAIGREGPAGAPLRAWGRWVLRNGPRRPAEARQGANG